VSLKLVRQVLPPSVVTRIVVPVASHPVLGETNCSRDPGCGEDSRGSSVVVDVVVDGPVEVDARTVVEVRRRTFAPVEAGPLMIPHAATTTTAVASAAATAATAATITRT
jgi:hypothetical protein